MFGEIHASVESARSPDTDGSQAYRSWPCERAAGRRERPDWHLLEFSATANRRTPTRVKRVGALLHRPETLPDLSLAIAQGTVYFSILNRRTSERYLRYFALGEDRGVSILGNRSNISVRGLQVNVSMEAASRIVEEWQEIY